MTLRDAQDRVDRWISRFEEGYWPPLAILARLMEEVGELSREINHRFGSKPKRDDEAPAELELEIADILFVLISLANQQGIDLDPRLRTGHGQVRGSATGTGGRPGRRPPRPIRRRELGGPPRAGMRPRRPASARA